MKYLPMPKPTSEVGYNHPPTKNDGAQKAIIIRDVISRLNGKILLKKGTTGVVIPLKEQYVYEQFQKHINWLTKGFMWNCIPHFGIPIIDHTYDFFHHFEKNGKKVVGTWHTYITSFDFRYIDSENSI